MGKPQYKHLTKERNLEGLYKISKVSSEHLNEEQKNICVLLNQKSKIYKYQKHATSLNALVLITTSLLVK